jgi:hypothetical protein
MQFPYWRDAAQNPSKLGVYWILASYVLTNMAKEHQHRLGETPRID